MHYPDFFDEVPSITLVDDLSLLLGAFENGIITFTYKDAVKLAGHSCPTVAGAYMMTALALKKLYKEHDPKRGEIKVALKQSREEGVTSVIANVISLITAATQTGGFKGIQGRFARHSLMDFQAPIKASARFTRTDTNESVDIYYDPDCVPPDPRQMPLLQKILSTQASMQEKALFAQLWQDRVKTIMIDNANNQALLRAEVVS